MSTKNTRLAIFSQEKWGMIKIGSKSLLAYHPEMHVLYMSGYTEDAIVNHGVLESGVNFIQKPFSSDQLAIRVREVLDTKQPVQSEDQK